MEIATGTTTGIIGRNGSGKTVLLKCICGLYEPTNGEILFQKDNCAKCVSSSGLIGAVIDSPGFLPNISGYKNLEYLSQIRNIPKDSIRHAMIEVGLDPKNRQPVKHYSLGMKQRLGIAQVIMDNPDILIFDEPTNGLDNELVVTFHKLVHTQHAKHKTIIIASHSKEDIAILCDCVYELDAGKIININVKKEGQ